MQLLRPGFEPAPSVKTLINIGALLDIPTGFYLKGMYGESVLNGGLGIMTAVVGIGNNFKSTVLLYMMLCAASRIAESTETSLSTYDTEVNIHESRLTKFTQRFPPFKKKDILKDGTWIVTDRTKYFANEMYEILKDYLKYKTSNASKISLDTPFLDRNGNLMQIISPTFGGVDSFTRFETEDVVKIQDENEIGESGGNTIHMRQGLAKMRFLMEMSSLASEAYHFTLLTAHIGKEIQMASGPVPQAPVKKLQYLKNGDKLKGVTDQFTFLMSNCWQAYNAAPLINQGTKAAEYPRNPDDNRPGDTDLNIVSLRQLRSKSGPTGIVIELIVSQSDGVLPELTEFHYLKSDDRYGISGTLQHYNLDLYPDCKLGRTTIRSKIDSDPKLCRALNITAELCQMKNYWRGMDEDLLCTPKELYDDLKAQGWDWDFLLSSTRGWWTVNNDKHPVPFLSTMDLLRMRSKVDPHNKYFPYWANEDKTLKKEFLDRLPKA